MSHEKHLTTSNALIHCCMLLEHFFHSPFLNYTLLQLTQNTVLSNLKFADHWLLKAYYCAKNRANTKSFKCQPNSIITFLPTPHTKDVNDFKPSKKSKLVYLPIQSTSWAVKAADTLWLTYFQLVKNFCKGLLTFTQIKKTNLKDFQPNLADPYLVLECTASHDCIKKL